MGLSSSQLSSDFTRPFDAEEFRVAWMLFKGELVQPKEQLIAKREAFRTSKVLRRLIGNAHKYFHKPMLEFITVHEFIWILAQIYEGNVEDKISYIFTMYHIKENTSKVFQEGRMSKKDYIELLSFATSEQVAYPAALDSASGTCSDQHGFIYFATFINWTKHDHAVMNFLASTLPPTVIPRSKHKSLYIETADALPLSQDPLNTTPSHRSMLNDRKPTPIDVLSAYSSDESDDSFVGDTELGDEQDAFSKGTALPVSKVSYFDDFISPKSSSNRDKAFFANVEHSSSLSEKREAAVADPRTDRSWSLFTGEQHLTSTTKHVGSPTIKKHTSKWNRVNVDQTPLLDETHLAGYLYKLGDGKLRRKWNLRWFVLDRQHGMLYYCKKDPGFKRLSIMDSDQIRTWCRRSMDLNHSRASLYFEKHPEKNVPSVFEFQLSTSSLGHRDLERNSIKLCAENEKVYNCWIEVLAETINRKFKTDGYKEMSSPQERIRHRFSPDIKQTSESRLIENKLKEEWIVQFRIVGRKNYLCILAAVNVAIVFVSVHIAHYYGLPTLWIIFTVVLSMILVTIAFKMSFKKTDKESEPGSIFNDINKLSKREDARGEKIEGRPVAEKKFSIEMCSSLLEANDCTSGRNAWAHVTKTAFMVRSSDYHKTGNKIASGPPLFDFLGIDVVKCNRKINDIFSILNVPGKYKKEQLFMLNVQVPSYSALWSMGTNNDGPGYSIVLYWAIPKEVLEALKHPATPHLILLKEFIESGKKVAHDRLKIIAHLKNIEECGFKSLRSLFIRKNGLPILTRPQHRIVEFPNVLEVDVCMHDFSIAARTILYQGLGYIPQMVIDVGLVLEGSEEQHLPERVFASGRMIRVNLQNAVDIDSLRKKRL